METRAKLPAKQIVPVASNALARRSALVVARGLRDLARNSNWLVKRAFSAPASSLAVSSSGVVCALVAGDSRNAQRLAFYELEADAPAVFLAANRKSSSAAVEVPPLFAWSPGAKFLAASLPGERPAVRLVEAATRAVLYGPKEFASPAYSLAWSLDQKYFGLASSERAANLTLWQLAADSDGRSPFEEKPAGVLDLPHASALIAGNEADAADSNAPSHATKAAADNDAPPVAFGRLAFSPDGGYLAGVLRFAGEWADDAVAFVTVPSLEVRHVFAAQGSVTDLSWSYDSQQLIFCASGQAYRIGAGAPQPAALPFGAELCACHPHLPLCLCFSSWLKNSSKGRLFLVDLRRLKIFDELAAVQVAGLSWNEDGSKAYAVTQDGLAYIYEPPLL
jgi:hypothetical protein